MKIAIIGLGRMGQAIAENLSDRDYSVSGYNRSNKNIDKLIFFSSNISSVLNSSEISILSLSDENAVNELFFNEDIFKNINNCKLIIDTTTHNPLFAEKMYKKCQNFGIAYIDAPVSGGPEAALSGKLSLMVGAEKKVFLRYKKILQEIGNNIFYMGMPGKGQAAKLVNQILVGISQIATCEALLFAKDFNLDLKELYEAIKNSAGDSVIFRRSAYQMIDENFSDDFQTYLIAKDLKNLLNTGNKNKNELILTSMAAKILEIHSDSDYKNKDAASIINNYKAIIDKINN